MYKAKRKLNYKNRQLVTGKMTYWYFGYVRFHALSYYFAQYLMQTL